MATQNRQAARDRINHLQVVVNREERRRIQERAMEAGLSVSAYLRTIGLGKAIRPECQSARFSTPKHTSANEAIRWR